MPLSESSSALASATPLAALLAVNALLHAVVVARFGARDNRPFLTFTFVYAALAGAVFLGVPFALWAVVGLTTFGLVGLTVTFHRRARDKGLDRAIWLLDAVTIPYAAVLLWRAARGG